MTYLKLFEDGYVMTCDRGESRLEYLSDHIFEFTTYDSEKAEHFAVMALEVCQAIQQGKTFEYIKDPARYMTFLLMVNMPFFSRRLNWGTSVRGAWWDTSRPNATEFDTCGLWMGERQLTEPLKFSTDAWREFIDALLAFAAQELNTQPTHTETP